jgi:hypothetical protein
MLLGRNWLHCPVHAVSRPAWPGHQRSSRPGSIAAVGLWPSAAHEQPGRPTETGHGARLERHGACSDVHVATTLPLAAVGGRQEGAGRWEGLHWESHEDEVHLPGKVGRVVAQRKDAATAKGGAHWCFDAFRWRDSTLSKALRILNKNWNLILYLNLRGIWLKSLEFDLGPWFHWGLECDYLSLRRGMLHRWLGMERTKNLTYVSRSSWYANIKLGKATRPSSQLWERSNRKRFMHSTKGSSTYAAFPTAVIYMDWHCQVKFCGEKPESILILLGYCFIFYGKKQR